MTSFLLRDLWLPEVEQEYLALLDHSRNVGVDVGNQFRVFEQILSKGLNSDWRPVAQAGRAQVYVMYGRSAMMLFAISASDIAVVKWGVIGNDYEQQQMLEAATTRAGELFP